MENKPDEYVVLEATYPHKLLLCMKMLLNGKKSLLQDEKFFLQQFQKLYPNCKNELTLLKLAYEQNIVDDFLEADSGEKWRKNTVVKKSLRILVKIIPEYCAVLLVESLMFAMGWDFKVREKRTWKCGEKEKSHFHDRMKIQAKNQMEILGEIQPDESRSIPDRKHFTGVIEETSLDDSKDVAGYAAKTDHSLPESKEEIHPLKRKYHHEKKNHVVPPKRPVEVPVNKKVKDVSPTEELLSQKPEQVKFYKMMTFSVRAKLTKALLGDTQSQCAIGDFYADSSSNHLDYKEAIRWYEAAAEKGSERAYFEIGKIYDKDGVQKKHGKEIAIKIYQKLAEQGYPTAQCVLGMKYRLGDGVPENLKEAEKWLYKAAIQQHDAAIRNLADLYFSIGDTVNSQKWYQIGATRGDRHCCNKYKPKR